MQALTNPDAIDILILLVFAIAGCGISYLLGKNEGRQETDELWGKAVRDMQDMGDGVCSVCHHPIHRSCAGGAWHHTVRAVAYAESEDHAALPA